jgi:hypothetical protein
MTLFRGIGMLADLIEQLDPEPYSFSGHYWSEQTPEIQKRIEFKCEFTNDGQAVVVDWRESSFELRIPFGGGTPHSAVLQLFVRGYGHMRGQIHFVDGNVVLSCRNELATVFGHACFDERKIITVVGTFEQKEERCVYSLNGGMNQGSDSLANVRSIAKRA